MENTEENKLRFFDQYGGQKIFRYSDYEESGYHTKDSRQTSETEYAELTPLHLISDEDAIEIYKIWYPQNDKENWSSSMWSVDNYEEIYYQMFIKCELAFGGCEDLGNKIIKIGDYLRSKGYSLPYNGLLVSEQVSRGWVVLKTKI